MNPIMLSVSIMSLAIGTLITLMSHHWLLAWIGLEINTLAIIPLMIKSHHPRSIEASTKYFLTQASASALLLFTCLFNAWLTGEWSITSLSHIPSLALSIALMTKLGLAPMHFWLPEVLQGITLPTGLILSTWQKIAPLTLLLQVSHLINLHLIFFISILSALIAGWGGINQTQIRKIMAFSSIGHLAWTMIIIKFSPDMALFNFLIYIVTSTAMFTPLIYMAATKMSDLSISTTKAPALTVLTMLILLSLAGLPPLTGFSPKLMIISELIKQKIPSFSALILLASLLTLFFYLRLSYILSMTMPPNLPLSMTTWHLHNPSMLLMALLTTMAILLLPLSPTLLTITSFSH
uniref:NADH-ubiquinone oxidoreductase chain 2 n=1 Tax=Cornufer vitiensis TaxID=58512 RepID=A0A0K0LFH4_9NEOB|nr:NADH dehydrogenase subunit 2 [Cornufer vitiensis]